MAPGRNGQGSGLKKPQKAMNTNGARNRTGPRAPDNKRLLPLPTESSDPSPVHDLLVMSHGPESRPADRSNHACLNSFRSSTWIMSAGG